MHLHGRGENSCLLSPPMRMPSGIVAGVAERRGARRCRSTCCRPGGGLLLLFRAMRCLRASPGACRGPPASPRSASSLPRSRYLSASFFSHSAGISAAKPRRASVSRPLKTWPNTRSNLSRDCARPFTSVAREQIVEVLDPAAREHRPASPPSRVQVLARSHSVTGTPADFQLMEEGDEHRLNIRYCSATIPTVRTCGQPADLGTKCRTGPVRKFFSRWFIPAAANDAFLEA